jgi:hypothetical protein
MNNTYNRMLILVVNERLEEGKRWDAVKAKAKKAILPIALVGALGAGARATAQSSDTGPVHKQTTQQVDNGSRTSTQGRSMVAAVRRKEDEEEVASRNKDELVGAVKKGVDAVGSAASKASKERRKRAAASLSGRNIKVEMSQYDRMLTLVVNERLETCLKPSSKKFSEKF